MMRDPFGLRAADTGPLWFHGTSSLDLPRLLRPSRKPHSAVTYEGRTYQPLSGLYFDGWRS